MKKLIFLISGAVITLIFVLLGDTIYEALYYEREFSNEMYNESLYGIVSLVTVLVAWGFAAIYYYVINSVSFSRWYHWLIVMLMSCITAPLINFLYPDSIFNDLGYDFGSQLFSFCLVDALLEAVLFAVASFSIRWWSSNCRHTPIPE